MKKQIATVLNPAKRLALRNFGPAQQKMLGGGAALAAGMTAWGLAEWFGPMLDRAETELDTPPAPETPAADNEPPAQPTNVRLAETVDDGMTFREAFATARHELGPGGLFEYRGHTYNTWYKEEWENQSPAEKAAYFDDLRDNLAAPETAAVGNAPLDLPEADFQELPADFAQTADIPTVKAQPIEPGADLPEADFQEIAPKSPGISGNILRMDADDDGFLEAIAIDEDRDGFVDTLAMDTDGDQIPDTFFLNKDGSPGLELLAHDPNRDGDFDDLKTGKLDEPRLLDMDDLEEHAVPDEQHDDAHPDIETVSI